jgi:hypothetical protein
MVQVIAELAPVELHDLTNNTHRHDSPRHKRYNLPLMRRRDLIVIRVTVACGLALPWACGDPHS